MLATLKSNILFLFSKKEAKQRKKELKQIIGFYPTNLEYFERAFLHKSATYIDHTGRTINNERLEYLGDAILDSIIANYLFEKYPNKDEGFLTQTRSKIVNRESLYHLAKKIGIDKFIVLHTTHSISRKNIYGDAFEAFIGAIYLDRGYYTTQKFVLKKIVSEKIDMKKLVSTNKNYKSQIIEWGQKRQKPITFITDACTETDCNFRAYVILEDSILGKGTGKSKKIAEQSAAKQAIKKLKRKKNSN